METTGVHQGVIKMHSGVMDTVFHSGDACDYAIKLSFEVSAVLRSEWTKYCSVLSVCDLHVTFH